MDESLGFNADDATRKGFIAIKGFVLAYYFRQQNERKRLFVPIALLFISLSLVELLYQLDFIPNGPEILATLATIFMIVYFIRFITKPRKRLFDLVKLMVMLTFGFSYLPFIQFPLHVVSLVMMSLAYLYHYGTAAKD